MVSFDDFVAYEVTTEDFDGERLHVLAHPPTAPADGATGYHWYPVYGEETFNRRSARRFFGGTCGMTEETRDYVVDQIDFKFKPPAPAPEEKGTDAAPAPEA